MQIKNVTLNEHALTFTYENDWFCCKVLNKE